MKKANDYMNAIKEALGKKLIEPNGLYHGIEGHLRLAREIGCGLSDFTTEGQKYIKENSYNIIYIIGCQLKPLLSNKEWITEIERGHKKSKYTGKKLHDEIEMLAETEEFYKKIYKDLYYDEINQQTYNSKNEIIEILNDIVEDFKIKNVIDFKRVVTSHKIK